MSIADDQATTHEEEAQEIAKLLSRAAKNYQMYLSNNRMFITSLENLKTALDDFLEINEVLTFVVAESELLHHNVPVYSNTDKYQSIAFRMYRDGVRLISFHKGITNDDLMAFFEALTKCMETDNLEEDFVTLLWEKDLQAITYYEVNDFEADYESLKMKAGKKGEPQKKLTRSALEEAPWNRITTEGAELKPTIALTAEDLQEVRDLTLTVDDELFLRRAGRVLHLTLDIEDTDEAYADLETAFVGYLDTCVSRRQIGLAAEMLADLKKLYKSRKDEKSQSVLSRIIATRYSEVNTATIGEILSGGRVTQIDQCQAYLSHLGAAAIPAVLRLSTHCTQQSARQALVASLAAIGESCPAEIAGHADKGSVEEIETVLEALETIGTDEAFTNALQYRTYPSGRVRTKVAVLAAKLRTDEALDVAESLILDEDHSVRRRALTSLVEIGGDRCTDTLIGLFTSKRFHPLSHDSKLSMLLVIRSLSPGRQRRIIEAIIRMRAFLRKKPMEDTKAALTEVIHLMDAETAVDSLKHLIKHSSGKLHKAAQSALEKVEDAGRMH